MPVTFIYWGYCPFLPFPCALCTTCQNFLLFSAFDDLIVFNNKKFIAYVKDIYPPELNVEKANRLDDQAYYLALTFIIGNNNRIYMKLYDKRDDFKFHIVNFPSLSRTYHLALHMVFMFLSLLDMQDATHIMMTLDIAINS